MQHLQEGQPIRFDSVFLSHSHQDKSLVRRVHDELQSRGVRCWLDAKDIKLGAKIRDEISRAIQLRDKVVLFCSRAALTSRWVEDEIDETFEKENENGTLNLIPLDLDGYLFEWKSGQASRVRTRLAGDFFGCDKDHAKFAKQIDRLILALQQPSVPDEGA